jgi:hypothetical protein
MRSDLGKYVTERPRRNSSAASAKAIWSGRIQDRTDHILATGGAESGGGRSASPIYFPKETL